VAENHRGNGAVVSSVDSAQSGKENRDRDVPRQGTVHSAVIETVHDDAVLVHVQNVDRDGFVPARELESLNVGARSHLEPGEEIAVRVLKVGSGHGDLVLSMNFQRGDWARAEDLMERGQAIEATVTGFNRGGVLVSFGRLRGFVPNSHLGRPALRSRKAKAMLVGRQLSLAVIEVDRSAERLILSERAAQNLDRDAVLATVKAGDVRSGMVRNLVDFGAFVDLGGVDGLIHISQLSWENVRHPSDVLSVGDEVEVYVLDVDRERQRISLSRKFLLPRPGDDTDTDVDAAAQVFETELSASTTE
jgi:small subunit ribosomal protein S1